MRTFYPVSAAFLIHYALLLVAIMAVSAPIMSVIAYLIGRGVGADELDWRHALKLGIGSALVIGFGLLLYSGTYILTGK